MEFQLSVRGLRRRWVATTAIVGAIGLSAALAAAMFAVVDGLLFRPLPFASPERLVALDFQHPPGRPAALFIDPTLAAKRQRLLDAVNGSPLFAGATQAGFTQFFDREAARDAGLNVTGIDARFFPLLGLVAETGATFSPDDELTSTTLSLRSSVPLPIILSHDLALRLFGDGVSALGPHDLAERHVRVVGVMHQGVKFPGETNLWAPVPATRDRTPAYARLANGSSVAQVSAAFPELAVTPLRDVVRSGDPRSLEVLFAASLLLLLLTWAQVGALVLTGAFAEVRQLGVMLALGAGRARLIRHAAVQSLVLVGAAFCAAWALLPWVSEFLIHAVPAELRFGQYLSPDPRTLVFSCGLALIGVGLLTILPTLFVNRASPLDLFNGRVDNRTVVVDRWRRVVLVVQMAVTTFLLYLSGLTLHSFQRATTFDYGFDPSNLLLFTVPHWPPTNGTKEALDAALARSRERIREALEVLPGLPGVGGASGLFAGPFSVGFKGSVLLPTAQLATGAAVKVFDGRSRPDVIAAADDVSGDFAATLRVHILTGADFDLRAAGGERQVMVNRTLADALVGGSGSAGIGPVWASVLGRMLRTDAGGGRIVAVIDDLVQGPLGTPILPEFYEYEPSTGGVTVIAIRVAPHNVPAVRAALERIWGRFSPGQLEWMDDELARVLVPYRSQAGLLAVIAAIGLPIAAVGLIGALFDGVRSRKVEIALRLAVGAERKDIRRMIVRHALASVTTGVAVGIAVGIGVGVVLRHQLFQVQAADILTAVTVSLGMLTLAVVGATIPAGWGARVEPATLLRSV